MLKDLLHRHARPTWCRLRPLTRVLFAELPASKVDAEGKILYRDAIRDALVEEMRRDSRVIFYGEDVADYGGAFKMTKGLLETFGRDRVFNTPISEAAICGTAVGAGIAGLRPVVELMYMDFALMASDQIANQAAKWHYMSGGQVEVPLVIRCSVGAGKGYGGQHSQSLESLFTHIPGLWVVYPATADDAKGLLKSAIRTNNPVVFVESQGLYSTKGVVPEGDYTTPIGAGEGRPRGLRRHDRGLGPGGARRTGRREHPRGLERGIQAEVIDLRSLVPLDMDTVLASVRKTGRAVVAAQAVLSGSFVNDIVARIQAEAFDDLDAPVGRIGAANGISPAGREPREGIPAQLRRHRRRRCGPDLTTARTASNAEGTRPMAHPILMPKPGQMTEECVLTLWRKEVGEPVHRGDVLFEIETDKSSMEVETFDEGVLLAKLVQDGETAPVNAVCGWIGEAGEAVPEAPAAPAPAAASRRPSPRSRRLRRCRGRARARGRRRPPRWPRPRRRQPAASSGSVPGPAGSRPRRASTR